MTVGWQMLSCILTVEKIHNLWITNIFSMSADAFIIRNRIGLSRIGDDRTGEDERE